MSHAGTIAVPVTGGKMVLAMTGGSISGGAGRDQLYLYVCNSDTDALSGRGQLYVFRVDPAVIMEDPRSASSIRKGPPVNGRFVPVDAPTAAAPGALGSRVQSLGCLNFVKLEDLAVDHERLDAFYFTDALGYGSGNDALLSSGGGRLYHVALDPFDPTRAAEVEVLLDQTAGDDIFHPSSIDTDERCVMIQENPGTRGLHPARILRYDTRARRVEAVAECAERDRRGRLLAQGVGGEWESSGIQNVGEIMGVDTWLFTVQAHTLRVRGNSGRSSEAGQLLLMRGSRNPGMDPSTREKSNPDAGAH